MDDLFYMGEAVEEAKKALLQDEIPVGAVVVKDGIIIGRGHNDRSMNNSPFGHAELRAITVAAARLKNWRLDGCTLYVTLEPCVMCAGAVMQCRIGRLVFGAFDPKAGGCGSLYEITSDSRMYHKCETVRGVRKSECEELLQNFFAARRSGKKRSAQ